MVGQRTKAELLYVGMTRGRRSDIAVADVGDEDGRTRFETALQNPSAEAVAALELIRINKETPGSRSRPESCPKSRPSWRSPSGRRRAGPRRSSSWAAGLDDGLTRAEVALIG